MNWKIFNSRDLFFTNGEPIPKAMESISPYIIPQAYRVFLDNLNMVLVLEFRYIAPDSEIFVKEIISGVKLGFGRDSKRIFMVSFDLSSARNAEELSDKFEQLRLKLEGREGAMSSFANSFSDRAIVSRKNELIHVLK